MGASRRAYTETSLVTTRQRQERVYNLQLSQDSQQERQSS
jgi:hypothetical protein